jgi:hypothetical protein
MDSVWKLFNNWENNRTQSELDQTEEARDWTRWQVRLFALNFGVIGSDEIFVVIVKWLVIGWKGHTSYVIGS